MSALLEGFYFSTNLDIWDTSILGTLKKFQIFFSLYMSNLDIRDIKKISKLILLKAATPM